MPTDLLPANRKLGARDAFDMLVLRGLEAVTRALRSGDAFEMDNLRPLAHRCRALADAFDARVTGIEGEHKTTES